MLARRLRSLLAVPLAVVVTSAPAAAQTSSSPATEGAERVRAEDRSPKDGTPLIANKLYPMQFRFEGSGFFDYSYADKYVQHLGGHGSLVFHLFDWLALEGFGGYLVGDETNILEKVRQTGASNQRLDSGSPCVQATCEPQLPDMWQTTWFAGANAQWAPIYGKISAFSEVDLSFQLYGMLGGGAEGIQKRLNGEGVAFTPMSVRPSVNYGLGLRLIPWKYVALRLELKNFTGLNPNVEEHDEGAEDDCPDGYILSVAGDRQCFTDFSNNAFLQVGISFLL